MDHARFQTQGYHVFQPAFLSPEGLRHAQARVATVYQRLHPKADPLRLYNLHQCGESWVQALAHHPTVTAIVEQHCGPDFYFYLSHVISKQPRSTYAVPWHQDYRTKGGLLHCSIWIALDDVDEENGCVCCVPKGHANGALPTQDEGHIDFTSVLDEKDVVGGGSSGGSGGGRTLDAGPGGALSCSEPKQVLPLTMRAGQASMLDPLMPHCSGRNRSATRWRRALLLRYAGAQGHVMKWKKEVGEGQGGYPAVYKDESWFSDYRTGELFEGVSFLLNGGSGGGGQ
jgi:ectoine hydroxylase-related dioxygenase (phytanoyl-CoA dioxygenase family)